MSSLRRGLAALVALVVVAMQVGGAVHLSTVQHAICVEHGELVDVPRAQAPATPQRSEVASAHEHEHCSIHALVASPRVHVASAFTGALAFTIAPRLATYDPPRAIAILSLAPKSSPPV